MENVDEIVSVPQVLTSLARSEHEVQDHPAEQDVADAARAWELTPTEAYLEGKVAGLAQAQEEVREQAGWPVEKHSHRD